MKLTPIHTQAKAYTFAERLLVEAFPANERRDLPQQRFNTDHHPLFKCCIVEEEGIPIGLLSHWEFSTFRYIEHFAISPQERNHGYGAKALKAFLNESDKPVILEVERPNDRMAARRIRFYERTGFLLDTHDYMQPPYRDGDSEYPMYLMHYGGIDMNILYETIKATLHKEVYHKA